MNRKERRAAAKQGAPRGGTGTATGDLFEAGFRYHQTGRLDEAERIYRQVLSLDKRHAGSLHLLGVVSLQKGQLELAAEMIGKAIAENSRVAAYHSNLGLVRQRQGRLDDAVVSYQRAIALKSDIAETHYNLGNALRAQGKFDEAIAAYRRAISIRPNYAEAHNNLGDALREQGKLEESVAACRQALALDPNLADANYNLGNALRDQGKLDDAIAFYRQAIGIDPNYAEAHNNLGVALKRQGKLAEAVVCYKQAIVLNPDYAEAHSNLGNALRAQDRLADAVISFERAITLKPDYAEAYSNLGNALQEQNKFADAVLSYERAIVLKPDYAEFHSNLGNALKGQGELADAVISYERAITLKPDYAEAHSNLGNALQEQGNHAGAATSYERALALKPDFAEVHNNLLMGLHYSPVYSNADILERARRFSSHCQGTSVATEFANLPVPKRRLRIGYVSGDFGNHPVGYFLAGILPAHDRAAVEVFCYSNRAIDDDMTGRLRRSADRWRGIVGVSDADAALMIRRDGIDILVDLSGHTAKNRLLLFARRPAPVQVTWLGYFGTTGLTTMDYILADRFVAPEDAAPYYTESIWRLPDSYLCFSPPDFNLPVLTPPATRGSPITFGSFNNLAKTSPDTIALWARVLQRVAGSRLLLKTKSLADQSVQQRLLEQFAIHGIGSDRLVLEGAAPRAELLGSYNRIDIALDPTPYGGGTTSAEASWMGVPVVTLRGKTWVGRVTESIISTIGLSECVASSPDEYVEIVPGWQPICRT